MCRSISLAFLLSIHVMAIFSTSLCSPWRGFDSYTVNHKFLLLFCGILSVVSGIQASNRSLPWFEICYQFILAGYNSFLGGSFVARVVFLLVIPLDSLKILLLIMGYVFVLNGLIAGQRNRSKRVRTTVALLRSLFFISSLCRIALKIAVKYDFVEFSLSWVVALGVDWAL